MRKLLFVAAAVLGLTAQAFAADMAVKAVPYQANPFTSGSGWYVGIGSTANVSNASVSGNNIFATSLAGGNLNAGGASVDVAVGYISGNTTVLGFLNWWRVEGSVSYQDIAATSGGASVATRWTGMQEIDLNADLVNYVTSALSNVVNVNFPTFNATALLPANVAVAATPKQYFGAVVQEIGVNGNFGGVGGETVAIAPGIKTGFIWQTLSSTTGKPNGGGLDTFAYVTWPVKGFTVDNVLGTTGRPGFGTAAVDLGTRYGLGVKMDF